MIYTNYLICANSVFINVDEYLDDFKIEVEMINKAKCIVSYGQLEDFEIECGSVSVNYDGNLYYLECNGINISLKVEDGMILEYKIR